MNTDIDQEWYAAGGSGYCDNPNDTVRLRCEPECERYDDSDLNETDKKELWDIIKREGVWCYIGEYLDSKGKWISVNSLGMCVGDELDPNYEHDMRKAVLEARKAALSL